jgi:co-chaperonin GroES (HSP10)
MIKVVGHRVLIRPKPLETKTESGIVISYGEKERLHKSGVEEGTVVMVGPTAWKNPELGYGEPGWEPWAKEGDQVVYAKYSGKHLSDPQTKEEFVLLNDVDIQAIVGSPQ